MARRESEFGKSSGRPPKRGLRAAAVTGELNHLSTISIHPELHTSRHDSDIMIVDLDA